MKSILAGLVALLTYLPGPASARDADSFRLLKLEGHQVRWLVPRSAEHVVVTYRLVDATVEFPGARNCGKITTFDQLTAQSQITMDALRAELVAAFAMWETSANITFHEATGDVRADILIGAQVEPEGWAFADVFYDTTSSSSIKPISRALVCLNPVRRWKVGFDGDLKRYDLRYTFAHEIGHAIGLDHPSGADQIMGYRYEERFRTLQPGDIQGAVALYGKAKPSAVAQEAPDETVTAERFSKRWGTRSLNGRSP